jgi:hypothetical protein
MGIGVFFDRFQSLAQWWRQLLTEILVRLRLNCVTHMKRLSLERLHYLLQFLSIFDRSATQSAGTHECGRRTGQAKRARAGINPGLHYWVIEGFTGRFRCFRLAGD